MKHVWMALCALLVTATFVNCGKKDDAPSASPSMAASCYNLQTSSANSSNRSVCNYNYAAFSGFTTYNGSSSSSYTNNSWWGGSTVGNTLNGCSSYQVMTYSPTKGLGCVDNGRLQYNGIPARYRLNTYSNAFELMPASAVATGSGYGYGTTSYNYQDQYQAQGQGQYATGSDVLRVCDDAEPCPSGLSCRSPLGNVPTMGVCYH